MPGPKGNIGFSTPDAAGKRKKSSPIPAARRPKAAMPSLSYDCRKDDNRKIDPDPKDSRYLGALPWPLSFKSVLQLIHTISSTEESFQHQ